MERVWRLGDLCREAGLFCPDEAADQWVCGMTDDSRQVRDGWLFMAVVGFHADGRRYAADAVSHGAVAVIWDDGCGGTDACQALPVPVIHVSDGRRAMAYLWSAWYGHPERRLRLVGVTGTNGKTTVSTMLHHIMQASGRPCGLIGTVKTLSPKGEVSIRSTDACAHMTTPDPEELFAILGRMVEDEAVFVVMEVSSHALALRKVEPLCFDVAIMTNLTPEHLDLHGDMAHYYQAKRRLFEKSCVAVVNADDHYGRMLMKEPLSVEKWVACRTVTSSACPDVGQPHTSACVEQICSDLVQGSEFRLSTPTVGARLTCPMVGSYNVMNAAEAALAALELGVPLLTIKEALRRFEGVCGRMERVLLPRAANCAVYIDFAHTPDALESLLRMVHTIRRPDQRIVLLFGCGGDRDRSKRREMAHIASRMADMIVLTSDNSRTEPPEQIMEDIVKGMDKESEYIVITDRAEAIRHTIFNARQGDIILLCGKGHETYEIDKYGTHPFFEADIVKEAAAERWSSH